MTDKRTVQAVGMCWFREEEYARVVAEMADGHTLYPSYNDWLRAAQLGEERLKQSGKLVVRAHLKLDDFLAWCAAKNIKPDSHARMEWGNEATYRAVMQARGQ